MKLNRNHYFAAGIIILVLGVQLRFVESFVLSRETGEFIARQLKKEPAVQPNPFTSLISIPPPPSRRTVSPPRWLGWALVSAGIVLVLHSVAMKPPGG
jgi:hypothetical protein